ncbi:hypothetical protein GYMLUDRAFT_34335 [Collybiopsis luxurians FD-317 M1]|nr:hypothetical protein GYMLUDRAFT_34335 [Collybiopsis luxurians FD-317 M1]
MYLPVSNATQSSHDDSLCSNRITKDDYFGVIIIAFLILMFYALALWDRWMNLKMKEQSSKQPPLSDTYLLRPTWFRPIRT